MKTVLLVGGYLIAIVLANLVVTTFGATASVLTSLAFIALDLTARDSLHELWHKNHLWRNMFVLICSGSILSALVNANAMPIAIASCVAFLASGVSDTLVYQALGERSKFVKMNGSNLVSAAVDSFIFPLLAFGWPPLWGVMVGNYLAKIVGGAMWAWVLTRRTQ
jgi:uncharacterized PurR-regulated membrane protein YhhQ (DUF165 family)